MSGRSIKAVRRQASKAVAAAAPAVNAVLDNERLTRERVEKIEQFLAAFSKMGFWRRVRWMITGR